MKKANVLLIAAVLMIGGSALAACPDNIGIFSTLYGNLLPGRASEAWCGGVGPGQPGNTTNAMSWDGGALGTQWTISDMSIDATGAVLISDTVDGGGSGQRTYQTGYVGGQFWLAGSGPWTDGDVELEGTIQNFMVFTTITFIGGNPVAQTSNITFTGIFDDCPQMNNCVVDFAIANAILAWNSGMGGTPPANYPPFLCGASLGELFQTNDVTISIHCAVDAETTSWTGLKNMYR